MASYLLLRSNKKTGPYTLEEIIGLGLKPYDLVWVEGRSAAWRYPSEIDELKEFAPAVEEQPYDRFYRRSSGEKHFHETVVEAKKETVKPKLTTEEIITPKPVVEKIRLTSTEESYQPAAATDSLKGKPIPEDHSGMSKEEKPDLHHSDENKTLKKGKVFVSMPKEKPLAKVIALATKTEIEEPEAATPPPQEAKKEIIEARVPAPPVQEARFAEKPRVDEKTQLKEEYSASLDDIKRMYIENYIQKKNAPGRRFKITSFLPYAGAAIFIVVLGTLVYLTLSTDRKLTKPTYIADKSKTQEQQDQSKVKSESKKEIPTYTNDEIIDDGSEIIGLEEKTNSNKPVQKSTQKTVQAPVLISDPNDEDSRDEVLGTPTNLGGPEITEKTTAKPIDFNKYVSISSNDYKRKAFGGIQDLQLTVTNDTKYILDKVLVEVRYLKPSEEPLKTEMFQFSSVPPNGSMTMQIPDSPRGIKVTYKIMQIESDQYDKALAGL